MNIRLNIRSILKEKKLTVKYLSDKTKIPEPSIHRMLKRNDYKISTLIEFAKALDVPLYALVESDILAGHQITAIPDNEKIFVYKIRSLEEQIKELTQVNKDLEYRNIDNRMLIIQIEYILLELDKDVLFKLFAHVPGIYTLFERDLIRDSTLIGIWNKWLEGKGDTVDQGLTRDQKPTE
ncbi:MAG: helix-turn-helix transcriptional regulator [Bacteroidales bacterium]|nr:helix-turn-helix transcriptional regulator [Bacteroidales bacterium]